MAPQGLEFVGSDFALAAIGSARLTSGNRPWKLTAIGKRAAASGCPLPFRVRLCPFRTRPGNDFTEIHLGFFKEVVAGRFEQMEDDRLVRVFCHSALFQSTMALGSPATSCKTYIPIIRIGVGFHTRSASGCWTSYSSRYKNDAKKLLHGRPALNGGARGDRYPASQSSTTTPNFAIFTSGVAQNAAGWERQVVNTSSLAFTFVVIRSTIQPISAEDFLT